MKLKSCYVENFGKLSQYSYIFDDGLNVIEEENGWGKSTFAAFLKAMLFGLEYTTARKYLVDRTRYIPWQGGKFGGNLTFSINNKWYRVERYFGKKLSEDTFVLYDMSTNMESTDFTANLGEEIWKVDRDSYEKSAFITLNDAGLLNDVISGRLGDIEEQEADMEVSSRAIALIDDEMKLLKSSRKTSGTLNKKKENIRILNDDLKDCKASLHLVERYEQWIQEEKRNLAQVETQMQEVEREQSRFVQYQKKRQLIEIINELKEIKDVYEREKVFFRNSKHVDGEIAQLGQRIKEYEVWQMKSNLQSPHTEADLEKVEALSKKYDSVVTNGKQIDEYITSCGKVPELGLQENAVEDELDCLEDGRHKMMTDRKNKPRFGFLGIFGILVMLGGAAMIALGAMGNLPSIVPGIAMVVVGVVFFILQFINIAKKKAKIEQMERDYLHNKMHLEQELGRVKAKKKVMERNYRAFLTEMDVMSATNTMQELLNIKTEYEMYQQMRASMKLASEKHECTKQEVHMKMRAAEKDMMKILGLFYENPPEDLNVALDTIKSKRMILGEKVRQYNTVKVKYNKFKEENDMEFLETLVVPEQTEDELSHICMEKKKALTSQKIEIDKKIASYIHDMNSAQVKIDKILDIETSIDRNNEEITKIEQAYKLLSLTKQCMESAKENLAEKYMSEMTTAFKKYLAMLGIKNADAFCIDTRLNVKVEHAGVRYDSNRLSTGKQDLVQICMRMALVDAIYNEMDAPPLIMDDPFVNLDKFSVEQGVRLLNRIAQEYQLIYFVCHSSRV